MSFDDLREAVADTPEHSLAAIPKYPVSMLPASARALVDASGLPAAFVAGSALAALAGAIGANVEVESTRPPPGLSGRSSGSRTSVREGQASRRRRRSRSGHCATTTPLWPTTRTRMPPRSALAT